jgi:hypothetical protein
MIQYISAINADADSSSPFFYFGFLVCVFAFLVIRLVVQESVVLVPEHGSELKGAQRHACGSFLGLVA